MLITRRAFSGALLGAAAGVHAQTSTYPTKPIRMVVPLAAGSAVDNAARVLTQRMAVDLGQSFVIENIPGTSGMIGAQRVAQAAPDGYTLGGFNDSVLTMVPHIYAKVGWNPLTDFVPVSLVGTIEWGLVVKPDSPYKSISDLISAAKAAPGKLNFSSGGSGSPQHIAMAMFLARAGVTMTHVPYKGATPAAIAVAGGEVEAGFQGLGTVTSLISGGRLRLLAVSTPQRLAQYPTVATVHESGLADFFFNSWFAMVAPKGTPRALVDRLHASVRTALEDGPTRQQLQAQGVTIRGSSPEEFDAALRKQYELYRGVIQSNRIQAD